LVAAIATIASDWIFYNQLREMREDRRAWVAPSRGSLVGFIANRAIRPKIDFTNTGKEPAHLIGRYIIPVTFGRDLWYSGVAGQIIIDFQKTWCTPLGLSVNAGGGGISYPNSSDSMQLFSGFGDDDPFFENQIVAGRQIVDGSTVIAFLGCIAYRTLDTIRHTAFCYAYEGRVTDPNFLTVCTVGNYAE